MVINFKDVVFNLVSLSDLENIRSFNCENKSMESYLKEEAYFEHISREASTTVVYYADKLIAYFTLHRLPIEFEEAGTAPRDALDLARMAVSKEFQQMGIGSFVITHLRSVAYSINERYLTTEALYEKWKWYVRRGFRYIFEDDIDPNSTEGFVSMVMDLFDEELLKDYFEV